MSAILEWLKMAAEAIAMSWRVSWSELTNGYFYPDD
jgi:hypothetical protein